MSKQKVKKVMVLFVVVVSLTASILMVSLLSSNNGSVRQFMEVLQALERQVQVMEYDVKCEHFVADSESDLKNPKPTGYFSQTHILIERGTGRVYKDREGVDGAHNNKGARIRDVFLASRIIKSFDGETSMQMTMRPTGSELGDYSRGLGQIGSEPVIKDIGDYDDSGLSILYPGFHLGKGLTTVLDEVEESRVIQKSNGVVEVYYLEKRALNDSDNNEWEKVVLDLKKDGVITQIDRYVKRPGDSKEYVIDSTNVEYILSDDGLWVPQSATKIRRWKVIRIQKYTFSNFKINHFVPDMNLDRFRIEFPKGMPVWDKRTGVFFTIGSPPSEP